MESKNTTGAIASFHARNIGGIVETTVDVPPGVTILTGRNATNRTSFMQAVMAAVGSDDVSVRGDATEGTVELEFGGETYTRTLSRDGGTVTSTGDPYLEDPTLADLFAFLLESNEARQAVARADDLRALIMRPVDVDAIHEEIHNLETERDRIDDELAAIAEQKTELPDLEARRADLESEIEGKRAELVRKESEIDEFNATVDESRSEQAELDDRLEALRDARSELERLRSDIDVQQESIESLRSERHDLEADLEALPEPDDDGRSLSAELDRLRDRKSTLERDLGELQDLIQFNEGMVDDDESGAAENLLTDSEPSSESVTDQLVDDTVVCWTCGSEVEPERIEATLDRLRDLRRERLEAVRAIESDLKELESERRERGARRERRESLSDRLDRTEAELEERRDRLDALRADREERSEDVSALEAEVEALETDDFGDVLELHKAANTLEFEIGQRESTLAEVTERIASIEDRIADERDLKAEREEVTTQLTDLRTRIDRIEQEAVDEFNTHMDSVLEMLGYDNLERIWIDRVEREVREGRRKVSKTFFELHVVRSTRSGASYEDTIDHLSESEREVTGLVFALAGYLVHDVHEVVPFVLLDSLEAIDSERIANLVTYMAEYAEYLIVALLPEDAQALDDDYTRITDI
ncbi:archaea-specific SMC-related protein [Halomarina rubra]|uniref:Archaea-specific SMC-related protein n=1 Tax=Halomarina rubra TaxID=2071873 RepID=A0ABD6AWQ7_9EURY|nr:archaea-specific SMC-related protein [Halomarina rubra]